MKIIGYTYPQIYGRAAALYMHVSRYHQPNCVNESYSLLIGLGLDCFLLTEPLLSQRKWYWYYVGLEPKEGN